MDLVSVIIPTYNRAEMIEECISSVTAQTYRPIEIIVVDDGSTDNTKEILEEIKSKLSKSIEIELKILHVSNNGASSARNIGVKAAKGKWFQFLDSDDILLPKKLEKSIIIAKNKDADIVYSRAQFINEEGQRLNRFWGLPLDSTDNDYFNFSWQTMCPIYSRKALDIIGTWNESLTIGDDWEFCIRGVFSGLKTFFLNEVTSLYRVHTNGNLGSNISVKKNQSREAALWSV
ncbi:MAG: glycosyltransferase, partial [Moorea sp. SIO2I5]|nr:glycosyltransferase [Moorena sp. SIO2I5]